MSQTHTLGKTATTISRHGENTIITYHSTPVVTFDSEWVHLDTGGWETVTTKLRMNQASSQFNLGYHVYQKDYQWFVVTPKGETCPFIAKTFGFPRS
jgi:hypothetical protein